MGLRVLPHARTFTMPCRAVIDVGTNSVKLLVAEVTCEGIRPVIERSEQTRLGQGFYDTHLLLPEPLARTARAVAHFAAEARTAGADAVRVIATSAARDAHNADELLAAIRTMSGLETEVVSGEQEAEWAFQGVLTDPSLSNQRLLILDVGGGSTEFILGDTRDQAYRRSFRLGAVRLLERLKLSDPPTGTELAGCLETVQRFLESQVAPSLTPLLAGWGAGAVRLVGTGGTSSVLAAMRARLTQFDREIIESVRLSREQVAEQLARLWSLPLAERKRIPGLPPERADVILTGVAIYQGVMEKWGFEVLRPSTRGMRFAALLGTALPDTQSPDPRLPTS